jgi:opacity protein-like surface antigen
MNGGRNKRWKWGLRFGIIILLTLGFLMPVPAPALAASGDNIFWTGMGLFSVLGASAIAYAVWEKSRPDQPRLLNGEFYVGGFLGAAFTPNQNLRYSDGFTLNNGVTLTSQGSATLFGNKFNNSLTGGVKLGYFFHGFPYLGLEAESSVNNSYVNQRTLSVNRPIQGASQAAVPNSSWINWTTALHIVGRYGFLPDKEVPFGRLQPYVGIGPAVIVLYEEVDSAKNFAIDVMAGVRYMFTKNISAFVEYKYNHQWDVEIESHPFYLPDGSVGRGTAHLDFDCHKVVLGLAYHW